MPRPAARPARIAAVRHFNRFYTRQLGLLEEHHLASPFSLTQVRMLYELAHRDAPAASDLCQVLGLDAGYVSRTLKEFAQGGLIVRRPAPADARRSVVTLSRKGRATFAALDRRARAQVGAMLDVLPPGHPERLVGSMRAIERLLSPAPATWTMRPPRGGDMGWVVQRHGELYAREYGWDVTFEGLVAGIVADFVARFDPARERCWIAERDGENVGCVFVVSKSKAVARLRMLLVEPSARGLGIGQRLVGECVNFAREVGYRRMTLWTQSCLTAARGIYQAQGFRITARDPTHSFGHDLVSETWELDLRR